jgi:hypothetical protein
VDPDSDPDPAIFVIDLQEPTKNYGVIKKNVFLLLLFEATFTVHHVSKIKSPKEVIKQ